MDKNSKISIALNILDRKIANLNMKILKNSLDPELKKDLNKYLTIKTEIKNGNQLLIDQIINGKEN